MQTYCGKNGCYDFEEIPDDDGWVLSIYLNSPIVFEQEDGVLVRSTPQERGDPEIEFFIDKDGEDWYVNEMYIYGFGMEGVNEFASALLAKGDLPDKNALFAAVESLLEQEGAIWGIVHPDPVE